jgi:hypothetical protein
MRLTLFFYLIICISTVGQPKPLFKIISCSERVTVDGVEAKPGEIIFSNNDKLNIPKGGYACVITLDGYVYKFLRGISVNRVLGSIRYNVESRLRTGAVHRSVPYFEIAGYANDQHSDVFGDSILIAFKCYYKDKPPFKITFVNLFDDQIAQYELDQTWEIFSVDSLLKQEPALLFHISSEVNKSDLSPLVKKIRPMSKTQLDFDLGRLNHEPVSLLALFEINKLYYDHIFQLYKIETSKNELILDEFLTAYLARTRSKYQLEEYMTK